LEKKSKYAYENDMHIKTKADHFGVNKFLAVVKKQTIIRPKVETNQTEKLSLNNRSSVKY
jgi:hypothetical protein